MKLIREADFLGAVADKSIRLITLQNKNGLAAQITNYGARWVSMWAPDKMGNLQNVLLGFDTLSGYYEAGEKYHGAIVGRVCGRIGNACFALNGKEYHLASNDAYGHPVKNHLHGGIHAFHNRVWDIKSISGEESVTFSLVSPDGEENYPGNLTVDVTYTLTSDNILRIEYLGITDIATPVNLTNHAFFDLAGKQKQKSILSHSLTLRAPYIIGCDDQLLPTGKLLPVDGQFYDFRTPRTISDALQCGDKATQDNNGFSIAFALENGLSLTPAACLEDSLSGRRLQLYTNQPSMQVYTGYFMDGTDTGHAGVPYFANAGIALEPQGYPDAPNHPEFPSVIIDSNNPYNQITEYKFDA